MRWKIVTATVIGLLLWSYTDYTRPAYSAVPITIRVTPRVGMLPHTILIQVRIEPNAENRVLCLVWGIESEDGMVSSSCRDIDGPQRAFQWYRELRSSGTWVITANIVRSDGSMSHASETVNVVGRF